ncbi:MAG: SRPBCC family protein [Acidimicrobiales bacterium]
MPGPVISRARIIDAPAQRIFDLLADPAAHARFDGSGSVKAPTNAPARLSSGARFGMSMKIGAPYKVTNQVVEFEEGRRIAWRHFGGHIWRYELEPVQDGKATRVIETFDGRPAHAPFVSRALGFYRRHPSAIEATLERLAEISRVERVLLTRSGAPSQPRSTKLSSWHRP